MNDRQIKALNSLYAATIEVLEAFAPECVGADQRREALSRMIENFLISASCSDQGIVYTETPRSVFITNTGNENGNKYSESKSAYNINSENKTSAIATSLVNTLEQENDAEVRYVISPVSKGNDFCFIRLKLKEDCDEHTEYPYKIFLRGETAEYEVTANLSAYSRDEINKIFPDQVVERIEVESSQTPTKLVTISRGELAKDGRMWKVQKRAQIKYV